MSSSTSGASFEHQGPQDAIALSLDLNRLLDGEVWHPVRAEFTFSKHSPFVVSVVFHVDGNHAATWRIGRDLLGQGLSAPSGIGDVQVWPADLETRQAALLRLASRGAVALFELPVPPLARWLRQTYRIVPRGTETDGLDWDAVTAALLQDPEVPSS